MEEHEYISLHSPANTRISDGTRLVNGHHDGRYGYYIDAFLIYEPACHRLPQSASASAL